MWQNTGKSDFLYDCNNFNKNWGWKGKLFYFIVEICKYVSRTSKNKLQAAVPVLCWYFFNLNEIVIVKKENISSILIAKMYEINFCHQCLAKVYSRKPEQFVWTWKGIPNNRCCPVNWAKYNILHIYFSRLLLKFWFKEFMKDFWSDFRRTRRDGCFCWHVLYRSWL